MSINRIYALNKDTDDDAVGEDYKAFRRLCSVVFHRAVADLFDTQENIRASAIQWFRRATPKKRETMIYFSDCIEVLNFTESRLKLLKDYIEQSGSESPRNEQYKRNAINGKRHGRAYYKKIRMITGGRY